MSHSTNFRLGKPGWHPERSSGLNEIHDQWWGWFLDLGRKCLHAGVDMNGMCLTARASDWRGLVGIQKEAQDLMRFMISGGGGFLIWEESACMLVLT